MEEAEVVLRVGNVVCSHQRDSLGRIHLLARKLQVDKALHDSTHGLIQIHGKWIDLDSDLFPMDHAGLSNSYELLMTCEKFKKI